MIPLSCVNCCHNPLQLGPIGTSFGYCTRHRVVLNRPHATTCGQLLRKDLLAAAAREQRAVHARQYPAGRVVTVAAPALDAPAATAVEQANGQLPPDSVVEEVQAYGHIDSKIASMAALHRIEGTRAEVAMLSLSRAYFSNCIARGGQWTSGVHLLYWTLRRLDEEPVFGATDLWGPIAGSLARTVAAARFAVVAFRLAFVSDVAVAASPTGDRVGRLATLAEKGALASKGADPDRLLQWLHRKRPAWSSALTAKRYAELHEKLHRDDDGGA